MATLLELLAQRWSSPRPLSQPVAQLLGLHLVDTLGAWIAGARSAEAMLLGHLAAAAGTDKAPIDVIALRAGIARFTEIDDIDRSSCTTPGAIVASVALTLAAAGGEPDARRFAQALAAGYEAMTVLGAAIDGPAILARGVWPTYFAAPFAAAAAAARIRGLDAATTANALALALTLSAGAPGGQPPGASPRWLLAGQAARSGALAALAAAHGYAGDRTLLDGPWLKQAHGIDCDATRLLALIEGGAAARGIEAVSMKPCCAAKQVMAAIYALREVLDQGVAPEDIARVRVLVPAAYRAMVSGADVATGRSKRITSAAYNLALAAYCPEALLDVARPDLTADSRLRAFMARIEVEASAELDALHPDRWPARVVATLRDGGERSALVSEVPGDPALRLDAAAVHGKFHRLAGALLGREPADAMYRLAIDAVTVDGALAALCAKLPAIDRLCCELTAE